MGCCYCDMKEISAAVVAGIDVAMLKGESDFIIKELRSILPLLQAINTEPFAASDVNKWIRGDWQAYLVFLKGLRERGRKEREPLIAIVKMKKEDYEKAAGEAVKFHNGVKRELPPPDQDWIVVVRTLATELEQILSLQQRYAPLEPRSEKYLKSASVAITELSKIAKQQPDNIDSVRDQVLKINNDVKEIEKKMKETKELLVKVMGVARESGITLKQFYGGDRM